jgi:hypothetical protein
MLFDEHNIRKPQHRARSGGVRYFHFDTRLYVDNDVIDGFDEIKLAFEWKIGLVQAITIDLSS